MPAEISRYDHILRKCPGQMGAQEFTGTTEVHPTRFAAVTGTAGHQWVKGHSLALMHWGAICQYARPRHNGTRSFVPHDERRDAQTIMTQVATQLRPADADSTDLDKDLVRLWDRSRERLQFHLMWAEPYQCTHFRRDGMVLHDSLLRAPLRSFSQGSVPLAGLYHRRRTRLHVLCVTHIHRSCSACIRTAMTMEHATSATHHPHIESELIATVHQCQQPIWWERGRRKI